MLEAEITKIYNKVKPIHSGKNADYIPELTIKLISKYIKEI